MSTKDINGVPVRVRDRVKILAVPGAVLDRLPSAEEREVVETLLGQTLEVGEIDASGLAWVIKELRLPDGRVWLQKLGLSSREMLRVA
jgi:hypothetical protein